MIFQTRPTHYIVLCSITLSCFLFPEIPITTPHHSIADQSTSGIDFFGNVENFEKDIAIETPIKGEGSPQTNEPLRLLDTFDDIDSFEDSITMDMDDFFDTVSLDAHAHRSIEIASLLGLLEAIGAFTILDQDFYLRTNPFAQRSLLDMPLWEIHGCAEPNQWIVGAHAFWNHMDRSVYAGTSTNIDSYINFTQTTLFETLNNLPGEIKALLPDPSLIDDILNQTNIDRLLTLFRNFTVQQRRTGVMFHAWRQWNYCEIRMLLPFYYIERNMFARPEEQAALEAEFGALDPDTQELFQKNYLISDKIGFGDFRFEADYALYKSENFTFRAGAFTTLPIAFALKDGIQGSSFVKNNLTQPTFDLQSLFDLIPDDFNVSSITPADLETAYNIVIGDTCKRKNGFFLGMLDRLSAMLLDTKLGNDQHLGIGFLVRAHLSLRTLMYQQEWAKRISFDNRFSVELLAPADETRFFVYRNKASDFSSRDFDSEDTEEQAANLAFIETELVNKFYPFAVCTKVQPGVTLRWLSKCSYCGDVWDITGGVDLWGQTEETFNAFCTSQDLDRLDIKNGKKPSAYQIKLFGSFALKWDRDSHAWWFGVSAEGTPWAKGIGKDWTVSLNIEVNF